MSDFVIKDSPTGYIKVHVWTGDFDNEIHVSTPSIGPEISPAQAMELGNHLISTAARVSRNLLKAAGKKEQVYDQEAPENRT
jgi:hypothetical protein